MHIPLFHRGFQVFRLSEKTDVDRWISSFFHLFHIHFIVLVFIHVNIPGNDAHREAVDGRSGA